MHKTLPNSKNPDNWDPARWARAGRNTLLALAGSLIFWGIVIAYIVLN